MTTHLILKYANSYKGLAFLAASAVIFVAPLKTEKSIMRNFSRGLNIQTSKREPPRIAFNEILNYAKGTTNFQFPKTPSINLNEKVEQKFTQKTVTLIRSRKVVLQPMVIARSEILEQVNAQLEDKAWVESLPLDQKRRILAAQAHSQTLDSDWKVPSWREELAVQLASAKAVVAAQTQAQAPSRVLINGRSPAARAEDSGSGVDINPESRSLVSGQIVEGQIVLQKGLGLGDGYIDVRHVRERVAQARGVVQLPNKYSIQVPDYSGILVATLYSRKGEKLGEGELRLSEIQPDRSNSAQIKILPLQTTIALQTIDFDRVLAGIGKKRDYGDKGLKARNYFASLDSEPKTDENGTARLENIVKESWSLVRTEMPGYMPSLNLIRAGIEKQKPLFREKFIKALLAIAKEQQKTSTVEETNSIVWGQAKLDGRPQAGIKIEVEFFESYEPIYFNSMMLPDPSLKATSENGFYVILHLPEGFHSLIATTANQYFSHANVQAEPQTIFVADLENTIKVEKVELKVYDAFSGDSHGARIEVQTLPEALTAEGFAEIYLPHIERLSLMKVTPNEPLYLPALQVYSDNDDFLRVPLVRSDWITSLRQQRKIDDDPNSSFVVGFVQDDNYDVYLPHIDDYQSRNIVYFNSQGQVVDQGVAGGGFVLFNVIPGTHSVVTVSKATNMAHSQVIPVDLGTMSLTQF